MSDEWQPIATAPSEIRDNIDRLTTAVGGHRGRLMTLHDGDLAIIWTEQFTGKPVSWLRVKAPPRDW